LPAFAVTEACVLEQDFSPTFLLLRLGR